MEGVILDMAGLIVRWAHLIFGIAWIGASFYFVWLDNSLETPPTEKAEKGVKGDLWSFHGGGIYEVAKYSAAPPAMPKTLHWFYWEAYSTWLSGMLLAFVVYYLQAPTRLFAPEGWLPSPGWSVAASLAYLTLGVLFYETLIRAGIAARQRLFALLMLVFVGFASWLAFGLFSSRGAAIHVGMLLGTIMAANVFIGIIPPQRAFVRAIDSGGELPLAGLALAKQRSTHNNYFTLPVLLCMISNHYPVVYGHTYAPVLLFALLVLSAWARHFFNLKHVGVIKPYILLGSFTGFAIIAGLLAWEQSQPIAGAGTLDDKQAMALVQTHCAVCHAEQPSWPGIAAAPQGLYLDSQAAVDAAAARSATAVSSSYMPLANVTGISDEERNALVAWLRER